MWNVGFVKFSADPLCVFQSTNLAASVSFTTVQASPEHYCIKLALANSHYNVALHFDDSTVCMHSPLWFFLDQDRRPDYHWPIAIDFRLSFTNFKSKCFHILCLVIMHEIYLLSIPSFVCVFIQTFYSPGSPKSLNTTQFGYYLAALNWYYRHNPPHSVLIHHSKISNINHTIYVLERYVIRDENAVIFGTC